MKILIKESKIFDLIYSYIDKHIDLSNVDMFHYMSEVDGDYVEDLNHLIIFVEPWDGEDYTTILFEYFDTDYYDDEPSSVPFKSSTPILEVKDTVSEHLRVMFNDAWEEPMKKWFEDNFKLPVKTITTE
jgi:hypothetical protein